MKGTRGNGWSLRAPVLFAAAGIAVAASGCIIDGTSGPVDSDGDGVPNIYDACPSLPEDYNNYQDDDGCPDGGSVCLPDLTVYGQSPGVAVRAEVIPYGHDERFERIDSCRQCLC